MCHEVFHRKDDNMKKLTALILPLALLLSACGNAPAEETPAPTAPALSNVMDIYLSDAAVLVNGEEAEDEEGGAVYTAHDIVYYEEGKDFTYGEGSEKDSHSAEEAKSHTVVHITKPGAYSVSGSLSQGQIAVDLGENAEEDPGAVVTLVLNGVDINCDVAPAIIFYNVYESDAEKNSGKDVDTSAAGANVIIADGTENNVKGSYVARIYNPGTVVLNENGTEVEDAKKLHKYDGAFYSKMSMNIFGGESGSGVLNIFAENEGLDSEMHLSLNGGNIFIRSGNDGINTNEDGVSVTTVNGGTLDILVTGETGEGDGIDSNGWLVINGGKVKAEACSSSADAGIDSDMGIHINGGTVIATGHMLDRIEEGGQSYAVFNFAQKQKEGTTFSIKDGSGKTLMEDRAENAYSVLVFSSGEMSEGSHTIWSNGKQLSAQSGAMGGFGKPDMGFGGGETPPEMPEGFNPENMPEVPEGEMPQPPQGERPEDMPEPPDGDSRNEMPEGMQRPMERPGLGGSPEGEAVTELRFVKGGNMFYGVQAAE